MAFIMRQYLLIFLAVSVLAGIAPGPAFSLVMTIDAIEDAGQFPGQGAYLRFKYDDPPQYLPVTTSDVPSPWTSKQEVYDFAGSKGITGWELQSGGSIWSSDLIVGDTLAGLSAGVYRVSVLDGAFMYDFFNWSNFEGQWRWQLHIQALRAMVDDEVKDYFDYMLGSEIPYDTPALALQASLEQYLDIPLAEGGSLIFWIWDNPNSIDNLGSLTFDVTLIPEPSTLILAGTGLLLLLRRYRKYISAH